MDDQMKPKPGDVIQPASVPAPVPEPKTEVKPVETTTQIASAPTEAPPVVSTPMEATQALTPPAPTPEVTPPTTPPPVGPKPTISPVPPRKTGPIFALVLFVVLLIVGAALYFLYFRDLMGPTPAPVEIRETTESTSPDRTTSEDTTSLQYLENEFNKLENEADSLTDEMDAESELNLGTSTNNSSEL